MARSSNAVLLLACLAGALAMDMDMGEFKRCSVASQAR